MADNLSGLLRRVKRALYFFFFFELKRKDETS